MNYKIIVGQDTGSALTREIGIGHRYTEWEQRSGGGRGLIAEEAEDWGKKGWPHRLVSAVFRD